MRFLITDIGQKFVAVLDDRWTFIRPYGGHGLYHIRNLIRVRNDYFLRFVTP